MKKLVPEYINTYFDLHDEGTAEGIAEFVDGKIGNRTHISSCRISGVMIKNRDQFRIKKRQNIPCQRGGVKLVAIWERIS